ncbi:MAG TPA: sodium:proton antiporter [Verrucomicrobiae bacterium]
MKFEGWYLLLGGLMLVIALLDTFVRRLPITTTIVYLLVGVALGPFGLQFISVDPLKDSAFLERLTEIAVIISLFTAGLKLRSPLRHQRWRVPMRLAFVSMTVTVGLIALAGWVFLGLSIGPAILLGAVLAPTDPVLASDVQLEHPGDRDRLRFGLTGEAGLNDGTAFPFVMLGLGLMGLHEIGALGWKWFAVDLVWAVVGGLGIGAILGTLTGKLVVKMRAQQEETFGRDEFIALGLIGFSYGAAIYAHAYGFLAVFAAGLALRQFELRTSGLRESPKNAQDQSDAVEDIDETGKASVQVAGAVLGANEQLERIFEIALVLILGATLSGAYLARDVIWFAPILFLLIRPAAVWAGTLGCKLTSTQRVLVSWFGIRGIGSLYYLMFAIQHGLPQDTARQISALVLSVVALSIFVHGISVSPIMQWYDRDK